MCINRMQEGASGEAVHAAGYGISSAVVCSAITADHVAACISQVGIVNAELRMVENVESFRAKFEHTRLTNRKVFQQAHIKVQPARVVQIVSTRISKRQAARSNERT